MERDFNIAMINLGEEIPRITRDMTQEMINGWADVVHDYNPLHVNPEYARTTRFGSTIAHGPLIVGYISEMMTDWLGKSWIETGKLLEVKFTGPVKPGDRISMSGQVIRKEIVGEEMIVECDVHVENENGVKVVTGRAIARVSK